MAISPYILQEINKVLRRPYFVQKGLSESLSREFTSDLQKVCYVVPGNRSIDICRDPKDNMVFACAIEARAHCIISGDKDITAIKVFEGISTFTPREFLNEYFDLK